MTQISSGQSEMPWLLEKARAAFLGAAVGDALGWPQEFHTRGGATGSSAGARAFPGSVHGFSRWIRRAGGRYFPHDEEIQAGEYSDDTQLLLCTARSLLHGAHWWRILTSIELPTWDAYERGGGAATKRAVAAWLAGRRPWSTAKEAERHQYFQAGGNGVAMRILPHGVVGAADGDFRATASRIVADGICTHGHPRALIGALAYGFAAWTVLRQTDTIPYGGILEALLDSEPIWATLPNLEKLLPDVWPTWRQAADEDSDGSNYERLWQATIAEMRQLLYQCKQGIEQGALFVDLDLLDRIGCFDQQIRGSGTISGAAAVFLASSNAADPLGGLMTSAFARGADTDTLAAMVGGILGAVAGVDWMADLADKVQDAEYIRSLASSLAVADSNGTYREPKVMDRVSKRTCDQFVQRVSVVETGDNVLLPDGRQTELVGVFKHKSRSDSVSATSWKLKTSDGQTLYVKSINRQGANRKAVPSPNFDGQGPRSNTRGRVEVIKIGIKLRVRDLAKSREFYEKLLGLPVFRESNLSVNFGDTITLVPASGSLIGAEEKGDPAWRQRLTVYVEVRGLDGLYDRLRGYGLSPLTSIFQRLGQRVFTCADPDGNTVELAESVDTGEAPVIHS